MLGAQQKVMRRGNKKATAATVAFVLNHLLVIHFIVELLRRFGLSSS